MFSVSDTSPLKIERPVLKVGDRKPSKAQVIDILALLDAAIDGLTSAKTSRSSRDDPPHVQPTGTTKSLKSNVVPVLPVVPVGKQDIYKTHDRLLKIFARRPKPARRVAR